MIERVIRENSHVASFVAGVVALAAVMGYPVHAKVSGLEVSINVQQERTGEAIQAVARGCQGGEP